MSPRVIPFVLASVVFVLDRVTKVLIETRVSPFEVIEVIPGFFNIIHTQNQGAAFGLFADASPEWRVFFLLGLSIAALALVATLLWQSTRRHAPASKPMVWGLGLILGGAVGNIYDRLLKGSVTDFLDFYYGTYHWATFNVADSAITIGAGLLIFDMLWLERRRTAET